MVTVAYCECSNWFSLIIQGLCLILRLKLVDKAFIGVLLHSGCVDFSFSFEVVTQCIIDFRRGVKTILGGRFPQIHSEQEA